jgi:Tol biopolymer transport system component
VATFVYRRGRAHDLRLLRAQGGPGRTLGRLAGRSPTPPLWSDKGRRVAYGDGASIVLVDIASNARRRVRFPARERVDYKPLAWSPDGSRIAVSTSWGYGPANTLRNALELVDLRRGRVRTLVRNPNPYAASFSADWSPDGNAIVYATGDPSEIFSIRPDGSGRTQLTDRERRFGNRAPPYDITPQWSPDGTGIAFTSTRDGISEVYVMAADGSGERRLTVSRRPTRGVPAVGSVLVAWAPDGAGIGYHRVADGTSALAAVDVDGRGARDLCRLPRKASVLIGVWPAP